MISVFSERTDVTNKRRGLLFYDGECPLCISCVTWFGPALRSRGFDLAPLQGALATQRLGDAAKNVDAGMRVLTRDGNIRTGADAVVYLAGFVWWAMPLLLVARTPFGMTLLRKGYRWVADHRVCADDACVVSKPSRWFDWLPILMFPCIATLATWHAQPWAFMWALAFSIFAACKWLTWREAGGGFTNRSAAYLFLWPGMDVAAFLDRHTRPVRPATVDWARAFLNTTFGALLLWGAARLASPEHWLLRGWIGMVGIVFLLHFGGFYMLALAWRRAGIAAEPIMRFPVVAKSLGEFWGARWNRSFNDLAVRHLFVPLRKRLGVPAATLLTFFVSGIIHESVISLPAGGGYGLPTLYFTLQGAGILIQRSTLGKRTGLRSGLAGRAFTLFIAAVPAYWLFHPLFVHRVVIPFLQTIGAL